MNRKVSTSFFNFRLFLEALKRLRVIGLGSAILALTAYVAGDWIVRNVLPSSVEISISACDPSLFVAR